MRKFHWNVLLFISLGVLLFTLVTSKLFWSSKEIQLEYVRLSSNPTEPDKMRFYAARQERKGVQKDMWYPEGEERLHLRLNCQSSDLVLFQDEANANLVEYMDDIHCLMQESIYYSGSKKPRQQLRYLEAKSGVFYFRGARFVAEEVLVSKYDIPGKELPLSIVGLPVQLQGMAKSIQFNLSGKQLNFKADHFKAKVNYKEANL